MCFRVLCKTALDANVCEPPKAKTVTVDNLADDFAKEFRRLVDFSVPLIDVSSPFYPEYKSDPKIPLRKFVQRIMSNYTFSVYIIPCSFIYIRRLQEADSSKKITINNMHRICAVAMLIAIKFVSDTAWSNEDFCRITGFDCQRMNDLELDFLRRIEFNTYVDASEMESVLDGWGYQKCPC